ncbi:MAG TPA: hypothetical protein VGI40_09005 [Pirellulaceae bacterium]|jgi:hypothetical protein
MLTFHTSVHGCHEAIATSLAVTFDDALAALQRLDRMFIEPDGSFVWTDGAGDGQAWQVDGNLIDRGDCLAYVELKGRCPELQLNQILSAIGWPDAALAFELTRRGVVVDEVEFRRLAASQAGAV